MEFYPSPSSGSYCSQVDNSTGMSATSRQQGSCGAQAHILSSTEPSGSHSGAIRLRDRSNTVHHHDTSTSSGNQRDSASGNCAPGNSDVFSKQNSTGGKRNDFGRRRLASKRHAEDISMSFHPGGGGGGSASGFTTPMDDTQSGTEDENRQEFGLEDSVCLIKRVKAGETGERGEDSADKKVFTEADLLVERQRHQADLARLETQAELYSIRKERELKNLKGELDESKASIRGMRQLIEAAASERGKLQSENKMLKRAVATQNQRVSQCNQTIEEKDKTIQEQQEKISYLQQLTMRLLSQLQEQPSTARGKNDWDEDDDGTDGGGPQAPGNDNGPFFGTVH